MRRPAWLEGRRAATVGGALAILSLYGGVLALGDGLAGLGVGLLVLGALLGGFAWDAARGR